MPSTARILIALLLPALFPPPGQGQDAEFFTVEESATPCLNLCPPLSTDSSPIDCPSLCNELARLSGSFRPDSGRRGGGSMR